MATATRNRVLWGTKETTRAAPITVDRGTPMLSGGEERLSSEPELVAWLAKVYVEIEPNEEGLTKRNWPWFDRRQLRTFLENVGVDIDAAKKADEDALPSMPSILRVPEFAIPVLRGLKFLNASPSETARCLRQRFESQARG